MSLRDKKEFDLGRNENYKDLSYLLSSCFDNTLGTLNRDHRS